ncbi:MAG: hypothetical protein HQK69_07380, partial [Desulfamplus sp.]|nr:hypothetical protein [Desulfamplus sp.]
MKQNRQKSVIDLYIVIFILISLCQFPNVALSEIKTVSITPFQINSPKDISYIQNGIREMLSSRLAWKERILVVSENLKTIKEVSVKNTISTEKDKHQNISNFDYMIQGSITEFAGAF